MRRCFQLALLGAGRVAPNPMVGALLVNNGKIISEGYHAQYGEAHAEVTCIKNVPDELKSRIMESTLYVSLEPCTHTGKTPPCADFIIKNKIPEVVISCKDSFEKVNGTGILKLQSAGIKVISGILEKEGMELNRRFFTFHREQRPYIILKWAQSKDLFISGNGNRKVQISGEVTSRLVHRWRNEEAAIMVGTQTALIDNPALTARFWPGRNPVRVVVDKYLKIPGTFNLLNNEASTIIINFIKQEENGNTLYYKAGKDEDLLAVTINILRQRNILSLIVEGGRQLLQSFIDLGLWDEARVITNSQLELEDGTKPPLLPAISPYQIEILEEDEIRYYRNN